MKTFSQLVAEAHGDAAHYGRQRNPLSLQKNEEYKFDPHADHSYAYTLKKTGKKSTTAHPDGKPTYDVIHNQTGNKIGSMAPYSAYDDKKKPGARIVTSRKNVTRYSYDFASEHKPAHVTAGGRHGHRNPAEALRNMARDHQIELNKKK